LNIKQTK